jgi:S1-C subfamily serine protease
MYVADIIIVLLCITALLRGSDRGFARQFCGTIGLLGGFFLGAAVQGRLIHVVSSPAHKALLSLIIILTAVMLFATIGEYVGQYLKNHIEALRFKGIQAADKALGAITAAATSLVVIWLVAAIFASAPLGVFQKQIKNSVIIANLNDQLPSAPGVVARLGHLIDPNGFPDVFTGLEPRIDNTAELPSIGQLDSAVQLARSSVVKVEGAGCGGISNGSGFVADDNLVITNAHVVAGVAQPYIIDAAGRHRTQVLWFDYHLDMAVLWAAHLAGKPLELRSDIAANGTSSAALGYPGGGAFTAQPAVVLDAFKAVGRTIYNQGSTEREVYSIKSDIEPGNSGGPLIDNDGSVIGLVFAKSTNYDNVGYALAMDAVIAGLNQAKDRNHVVGTGSCTS